MRLRHVYLYSMAFSYLYLDFQFSTTQWPDTHWFHFWMDHPLHPCSMWWYQLDYTLTLPEFIVTSHATCYSIESTSICFVISSLDDAWALEQIYRKNIKFISCNSVIGKIIWNVANIIHICKMVYSCICIIN